MKFWAVKAVPIIIIKWFGNILSSVPNRDNRDNIYTLNLSLKELIFSLINLRIPKQNTWNVSSFEVPSFSIRLSRICVVNVSDFQHLAPMCFHFAVKSSRPDLIHDVCFLSRDLINWSGYLGLTFWIFLVFSI